MCQTAIASFSHEYLMLHGVVSKAPTGKRDRAAAQEAFVGWHQESGRPLVQVSQILAMSIGEVTKGYNG